MLDIFEAMTTDERRVLYTIAVGCLAVGVGGGFWFYSEWAQLKRLATHLVFLTVVVFAVWYVLVEGRGGPLSTLIQTPATPPSQAATPTYTPLPPSAAPPVATPTPAGAWWE